MWSRVRIRYYHQQHHHHHRRRHRRTALDKVCNAHVMINIDRLFGVKHRNTANQIEKEEVETTHRSGHFFCIAQSIHKSIQSKRQTKWEKRFSLCLHREFFLNNFSKVHFHTITTNGNENENENEDDEKTQ